MSIFDWGEKKLEDWGVVSGPPAESDDAQMMARAADTAAFNEQVNAPIPDGPPAPSPGELDDIRDGQRITGPIDASIAADTQHTETPPPNYWHTEDNPYYTQ